MRLTLRGKDLWLSVWTVTGLES